MIRNTTSSWGSISRWLHWILGVTIIGMLAYGWWMNHFPARADRFFYRSIHADIGYIVLLLTVVRLLWRSSNPTPALPSDTPRWQLIAARASHWTLYALMILVPMLGWAHSGARTPNYADWFGLFNVPQITSPDKAAARAY
jgi:cytochrome b561